MSAANRRLRDFAEADLPALVDLWVAAWKATGVPIDFDARRGWIEDCLAALRAGGADIVVALDRNDQPRGFVTINSRSRALDQLCVAPRRARLRARGRADGGSKAPLAARNRA